MAHCVTRYMVFSDSDLVISIVYLYQGKVPGAYKMFGMDKLKNKKKKRSFQIKLHLLQKAFPKILQWQSFTHWHSNVLSYESQALNLPHK